MRGFLLSLKADIIYPELGAVMKLGEGVEWAAHVASLLAMLPGGAALPLRALADFFDLPEAYLAKHLQKLSRAGLVQARRGPGGGYALARPAAEITLADLVQAVEGSARAFRCTELRQRGPSGVAPACYKGACGIARAMWRAEAAWVSSLMAVTLAELAATGLAETPPEQGARAATWFQDWFRKNTP